MMNGTPQYSRRGSPLANGTRVGAPASGGGVAVPPVEQRGKSRQPRINLLGSVSVVAPVELLTALRAEPGTVGPAERMHRLGQKELVVKDAVELELVVVIDPRRRVRLPFRDNDWSAGDRIKAR
jgi:hypothetical protein